jgi:branched-chain amino acid aminotransferase
MKSDLIWMDGELIPYEEATVHIINPTLQYGVGIFEGIRCYQTPQGPAVFRLQDHLK